MKKFILVGLMLSSNIGFCPGEGEEENTKSISRGSSASEAEKQSFKENVLRANQKRDIEDVELDEALKNDPEARAYLYRRSDEYRQKAIRTNQRDRDDLFTKWDTSSAENLPPRTSKLNFAPDVVDRGQFNPLDVDTWDLNRLKKIRPKDIENLSEIQVGKLLDKPDYLKSLKPEQLQAISPIMFLKVSSEELIRDILDNPRIVNKFNSEQILAMNLRTHLDKLSVVDVRFLFRNHEFLDALSQEQVRKINPRALSLVLPEFLETLNREQIRKISPETLSQALYDKLPEKLSEEFVEKLSNEQIVQLFNDHVTAWFKNWGTSFKENFTPEALKDMQGRIQEINKEVQDRDYTHDDDLRNPDLIGVEPLNRF